MIKSFKIYEGQFVPFKVGDNVIVVRASGRNDDPFIGLTGEITFCGNEDVYSVIFDKEYPGTHSNQGKDPSCRTRNFYKNCLELNLNKEELEKRELERRLRREKNKHLDPFEEEIW